MRRRLLLVALVIPVAASAVAHGCSNEPPFESVCDWLSDPENCFREFHKDMLAAAGPDNPNGDCRTYPATPASGIPTEASAGAPGVSNGIFMTRAKLDTCILSAGGQVTIDPPIDLTMFPPSIFADPVTYTLKFVNPDGTECGNAKYTSPHGFSITIDTPPDAGATAATDAAAPPTPASDDAGPPMPYGTFTQVIAPARDAFDVTCPSGESHHFNLNEVNGPPGFDGGSTSACSEFEDVVPTASFQIYPGGVDVTGAVSFAIAYPPATPTSGSDAFPDGGPPLQPDRVIYFNCQIPAQAETCADGVKNGLETDIDCGGPQIPSQLQCGDCPTRCEIMQQCICDNDCDTNAGLVCGVDPTSGMRKCSNPTVDGGMIKHFPLCAYNADAGAGVTCPPSATGGTGGGGTGGGGTGGGGTGGGPADAGTD